MVADAPGGYNAVTRRRVADRVPVSGGRCAHGAQAGDPAGGGWSVLLLRLVFILND